ncbi:tyrosine-protein phosphatase [Gordonia sp. (in: high G+C Gram-positive bacteria)]|uniref:tyrosine-protein phosphatase n=1 Tax=Gordonia sp. (in: high G+C Gram-positive bacteria) TaxID=84139 RepID=UPI003C718E3C
MRSLRLSRLRHAMVVGIAAVTMLGFAPTIGSGAAEAATVRLDAASNFRDIGGYQTVDGKTVRSGLVFRSNKLSSLTASDQQKLTDAGITLDVDLRNASERQEAPDQIPPGMRYQVADVVGINHGIWFHEFVPITLGRALIDYYTSDSSNLGQSVGYPFMVSYRGSDFAFGDLVKAVARNDGGTVFHCSAGKDRTGWGAAILLSILGVPRASIEADFMKSNAYLGREKAVELSWLTAAYDQVKRLYGTMDRYIRYGLRIDQATITALRARLLS